LNGFLPIVELLARATAPANSSALPFKDQFCDCLFVHRQSDRVNALDLHAGIFEGTPRGVVVDTESPGRFGHSYHGHDDIVPNKCSESNNYRKEVDVDGSQNPQPRSIQRGNSGGPDRPSGGLGRGAPRSRSQQIADYRMTGDGAPVKAAAGGIWHPKMTATWPELPGVVLYGGCDCPDEQDCLRILREVAVDRGIALTCNCKHFCDRLLKCGHTIEVAGMTYTASVNERK
jgi:hypothetical protein